jgi:poly-gamma-glutamate synthesis protein (capsule biosynthesis protein)
MNWSTSTSRVSHVNPAMRSANRANHQNDAMRTLGVLLLACLLTAACGEIAPAPVDDLAPVPDSPATDGPTVRVLLVGDVMTGRGVAPVLAREADEVFAGVRHLLAAADIVGANLESPLTTRPHTSANDNALEADPAAALVLAAAGFDVMSLPNNHSTDAGPQGLLDTLAAVEAAGMRAVGAGADAAAAHSPMTVEGELAVGFLAYDATGVATSAGVDAGVASWDEDRAAAAVRELRNQVDLVVVSVHGGTEYLRVADPGMLEIAEMLIAAGADVVWGHGAHVVQPVQLAEPRAGIVATSLGNFLFDQSGDDRTQGAMLEVVAGEEGVRAYRVGISKHPAHRVEFVEWLLPEGDAVWLDGSWWSLARAVDVEFATTADLAAFRHGDLVTAVEGDITGDGKQDVVASFRRPHRTTPLMELRPDVQWEDALGRSAHLGVFDPNGLREIWVAGTVVMPVAGMVVCDGAIATVHDALDDPGLVAAGAWEWNGFGFDTAPDIPGPGMPGCADIDGDGRSEPVIVARGAR